MDLEADNAVRRGSVDLHGGAGKLISAPLLDIERLPEVTVQLRPLSLAVIRVVDAETGGPIANANISSRWFFDDACQR